MQLLISQFCSRRSNGEFAKSSRHTEPQILKQVLKFKTIFNGRDIIDHTQRTYEDSWRLCMEGEIARPE